MLRDSLSRRGVRLHLSVAALQAALRSPVMSVISYERCRVFAIAAGTCWNEPAPLEQMLDAKIDDARSVVVNLSLIALRDRSNA